MLLQSSGPPQRALLVASWVRALVPTAVLVVGPPHAAQVEVAPQDAITVNADDVASGPLAVAAALARAAGGGA